MRILMVHNYYQQRGGEDESTEQEMQLLRKYGHEVQLYSRHNDEIKDFSGLRKGLLFLETTWSLKSYGALNHIIQEFQPEIVHFQNLFPLISPAAYYACIKNGVPTVQTLRNYRLMCPVSSFFRNGRVCEECLDHSLWRGISYGCYRDSRAQTTSVALMLSVHRSLKTWDKISAFVALTDFSRQKFIEGGLPKSKIFVRPNFLDLDPDFEESSREYALFVGRLSSEKGLVTLLKAWCDLPDIPLKIIGDGPLRPWVEEYVKHNDLKQVEIVGFVSSKIVLEYQKRAKFLVMPSEWYETFGRTIIEAYATRTPVIASRLGAMAELVMEGKTGLLFTPGDSADLVVKVKWALDHPHQIIKWQQECYSAFKQKFSSKVAYNSQIAIYNQVINQNNAL